MLLCNWEAPQPIENKHVRAITQVTQVTQAHFSSPSYTLV